MTPPGQDEYSALRATIRERGTARVCLFVAGIAAWAALTVATAALAFTPVASLLPLLVLASVFEAIFALHIGVERIGRYLQVFYEPDPPAPPASPGLPAHVGWEHAAMAFGRPAGAARVDALFTVPFLIATLFNLAPALLLEPARVELIFVGGAHLLFVLRLLVGKRAAVSQRAIDLGRFAELRTSDAATAPRRP